MNKKGLTISVIFEAESANYGEGFGNISTLKKLTRGDGKVYSYISRQALRYNMVEQLGWDNTPTSPSGSGEKTVIQFMPNATIKDYPEIDMFGYMKTEAKKGAATRNAVARISNAISLESYNSDLDFLTNMGLAKRTGSDNSIAQSEVHKSYYTYTLTIDLDKVGIDGDIEISNEEKKKRVVELLKTTEYLYRDIRGRRENLAPVFVVGGVYERKNPFFENRIRVDKNKLDVATILDIINSDETIKQDTNVGYIENTFSNNEEIKGLNAKKVSEFFGSIIKNVEVVFSESN